MAQGLVSVCCSGAILLPRLGVAPGRDDRVRAPVRDGIAAAASVVGAVSRNGGNRFALGDLGAQIRQHRCIAHAAAGDLNRTNFQRRLVHGQMDFAPNPPARTTVLARMPFAFAADLDARAVDEQVQRTVAAMVGQLHSQRPLSPAECREVRDRPIEIRELQQACHEASRWAKREAEQDLDPFRDITA